MMIPLKAPLLAALAAIGATISGAMVASAAKDQQMATLYDRVKSGIRPRSDVPYLVADQKRWLAHRDGCWSKRCIVRAYDQRIDTLAHYAVIRDD